MKLKIPQLKITPSNLITFCWVLITLFLTRQFPLSFISFVGNLALWSLFALYFPRIKKEDYTNLKFIGIYVLILFVYTIFMENQLSWIFRFTLIIFSLLYAYLINLPSKMVLKWLVIFTTTQCLLIILMEVSLMFFIPKAGQSVIRQFFLTTNWGDVYTYDGFFFRVQIKGSGILTFVYCLSWVIDIVKQKWKWVIRVIFLLGIIIAGNFAFLVGIFAFHLGWFILSIRTKIQLSNRIIIGFVLLLSLSLPIYNYVEETMERKSGLSTGTRIDQTEALIADLNETPTTQIFGQGLGNSVNYASQYRDYRGMQYYELQVLYFINQMGLVGFAIFVIINFYFTNKYIDPKLFFVYLCYILYASFNPYIMDTTNIVVIITLISCSSKIKNEKNHLHTSTIQS